MNDNRAVELLRQLVDGFRSLNEDPEDEDSSINGGDCVEFVDVFISQSVKPFLNSLEPAEEAEHLAELERGYAQDRM